MGQKIRGLFFVIFRNSKIYSNFEFCQDEEYGITYTSKQELPQQSNRIARLTFYDIRGNTNTRKVVATSMRR